MANQLVPSSSFTTTPSWTYDVFLSFRGEDTRTNFTDHLYQALVCHGIHTFIDHSELPIGEEIAPTLLKAIENSRISVIIFSENYASSRWCLDELVHILKCRKSKGQMTRSIFYKVDPSDVRHQRNSYDAAFADHSLKYENNLEKVQGWRTALTKAADLKGATLNKGEYEATFISNFIAEISTELLNRTYWHVASYPVGIESRAKEVEELLGVGGNDRRVVGIWGTSGIGKTTIARAVYNASAHKFEGSCFLANVRETLKSHDGVIKLQNTLLSKILCGKKWKIVDEHEGTSIIKNRLSRKKILLILDDVDDLWKLKDWVDVNCFGEGSRVIITTKDRKLLKFCGGQWIYEVQKLGCHEALELFCWNAFKRNRPPDDYLSLAGRAIVHAQGLPLALNLIGSYLRNESIGCWQAVLNSYDSYFGEPYTDIQKILRKTYDAWDCNLQKVFLDIACFFKGENKDYVLQILRSSTLKVRQDCIEVLVEKAIITIEDNRILMHDLLEKMGKHIVYEESPTEPGKRSRLWHHEDVCDVLIDCRGTEKIRGIVVNLPKPDEIPLNPKSFLKMVNLEFFINRNAHFSGRVDYLSNSLRLIEFGGRLNIDQKHTYVLNLRSNFHPRHLVKFDVSYSGIRQLKEFKNLAKLTWMNLSGCEFLEKIPDLSGSPNIRELDLTNCTSLVEVQDSVGCLDKLEVLYLGGCSKLTGFAKGLGLRSLRSLTLNGCRSLKSFPEIEGKMESLRYLDIEESGIRELPSIAYFTNLGYLNANDCELQNIQLLPFGKKVKFDEVSSCSTYVHLSLDLEGCNLSESDFLVPLVCWSTLKELNLSRNNFVSLSDCISKVVDLTELYLRDCKRLREIPVLPPKLRRLLLDGCTSLVKIPKLPWSLEHLSLYNCSGLSGDEVAKLENNLVNEEIRPHYDFSTIYPGNEVPKWCSYTSNHPTTFQPLPEYESDRVYGQEEFAAGNEFRFEFPLKLQVGEMLVGLALCFVVEPSIKLDCGIYPSIIINGKKLLRYDIGPWHGARIREVNLWYGEDIRATHVRLALMSLWDLVLEPGVHICQFVFRFQNGCPVKSCGVHCLLRPTSSLGMRPHPRGSSDIVDDEYDQELQWIKFIYGIREDEEQEQEQEQPSDSDDHPKRWQIDLNKSFSNICSSQ
ncbi:TMV resistance protein N-like [Pyrus ussuriensis x Pyrus communis]|uniref:TMV resistance protein N-like n=1 Tax=Pyrus ussuriensis x Pyrus communis TaxID=2448454 RepID=A0A5N5IF11_9ROSA|nr:TMV resistance protein N-like [Pyrus ussuriensis x Pyrus communis]